MAELRWTPKFLNSGSPKLVSSTPGVLRGVTLSAGGAAASASIFDNATSVALSLVTDRVLLVRAAANTSFATPDTPLVMSDGLTVSLSAGAFLTVGYITRR